LWRQSLISIGRMLLSRRLCRGLRFGRRGGFERRGGGLPDPHAVGRKRPGGVSVDERDRGRVRVEQVRAAVISIQMRWRCAWGCCHPMCIRSHRASRCGRSNLPQSR